MSKRRDRISLEELAKKYHTSQEIRAIVTLDQDQLEPQEISHLIDQEVQRLLERQKESKLVNLHSRLV